MRDRSTALFGAAIYPPYLKNSNQPAIEYIYAKFRSVYQPIPEVMTRSRVKYVGLIAAVSLLVALFLSAVVYSWTITPPRQT